MTTIRKDYIASKEVYDKALNRRKRNLIKRLVVFAVFLILMISGFVSVFHSQSQQKEKVEANNQQLHQQLTDVQKQQKHLTQQVKLLHDDDYLSKIARSEYYMSKNGEIIFASPEKDKH
ncbi:FtsB family cell division protein [Pullulanibacillus camelliae]|uniref:FtsB family cell division protein n=1 Tax=Pullulanibacillus camelliae TaxID=1707096 RepID=UPI001666AE7B|nr:septum formation initiator family protein [Pullulanibacillus camelliae]